MQRILAKTILSKKPSSQSIMVGLAGYLVLILLFIIDDQSLTANGHLIFEKGEYWKAFTTTLMHGDFNHLGHNTIFFVAFAILLNYYFGLWIFPILSFIVGGVINLIVLKIYEPQVYLVGVSGVIYFMAAFWMTMFVGIERHMKLRRRLIIASGVSLILFFPEVFERNVSYLAHGIGFGFGIILGIIYFFLFKERLRNQEEWKEKPPENTELEEYILSLEQDNSEEEQN